MHVTKAFPPRDAGISRAETLWRQYVYDDLTKLFTSIDDTVTIEATSDTVLTFTHVGSDGVSRSATLTLA